jgi:hypothetical protein
MMNKRTIFTIMAVVLVFIIFSSMPINFAHKIGKGCPLNQDKPILKCQPFMYHSVTSSSPTGDLELAGLPSTPFIFHLTSAVPEGVYDPYPAIFSDLFTESPPLRC